LQEGFGIPQAVGRHDCCFGQFVRWTPGSRDNIQDLRGRSGRGMGIPLGIGGVLVLLVGSWLTGVNLFQVVDTGGPADVAVDRPVSSSPEEERMVDFVDAVMGDVQNTWSQKLANYQPTRAVLFRDSIQSACGLSSSATGPFYCPGDRLVYLDLGFFDDLHQKLGAPGDFAQAYVLAHEMGHHVQNLTGTLESGPFNGSANDHSVRVELQADCYAGVWGHEAAKPGRFAAGKVELDPGDVEEGLNAAAAVGDDRLQQKATGRVVPESFTHGSSAQRVSWFRRGMDSGDPHACDTFSAR
jgi:predicted metalloprotease